MTTLELEPPREVVTESDLAQFRGDPEFYSVTPSQFPLQFIISKGVRYLVEQTQCHWLLTEIIKMFMYGSNEQIQYYRRELTGLFFTYKLRENHEVELICSYDTGKELEQKRLRECDLASWVAMEEVTIWLFPNQFPGTGTTVFWTMFLPQEN